MSQRSRFFPLLIVLLAAAPGMRLAAQPGPLAPYGPEIRLNGEADPFALSVIAADPAGGLQMVWQRTVATFRNEIWTRRFNRGGHPSGPAVRIDTPDDRIHADLTVVPLGPGRSAALWITFPSTIPDLAPGSLVPLKDVGSQSTVSARLLGADGQPLGGEAQLDVRDTADVGYLTAAPLSGGGFVAAWIDQSQGLVFRTFDADAQPLSGEIVMPLHNYVLGGLAEGGFLAYWKDSGGAFARRFGADGQPAGAAFAVDAGDHPSLRADGSFVSATAQPEAGGGWTVTARLWDAAGHRLGADIAVGGDGVGELRVDSVAVAPSGDFLIVWEDGIVLFPPKVTESHVWARLFDATGHPTGPAVRADSQPSGDRFTAQAVTDGHDWVIAWTTAPSGDFVARRFSSACATPDRTLCLQDSRFRVDVNWHDPRSGATGTAKTIPQTSDTGGFWFFGPDNLELTVKVLDGRAVNGHFWVFYGSLSDVEFTLDVTDSATGVKKSYHKPPYTLGSKADTAAF